MLLEKRQIKIFMIKIHIAQRLKGGLNLGLNSQQKTESNHTVWQQKERDISQFVRDKS